jgi:hypothetical protein
MSDAKLHGPVQHNADGLRELFGIRARLVGDELIDEQGKVLAVANRRAFHAWLRSSSAFPSLSVTAALATQEE